MSLRRISLRHIFLCLGIFGLLVNLAYDFRAFHESKVADQSGLQVIRQYQVENALERLEHAVEVLLLPPITSAEFDRVKLALASAQHLVTDPRELEALHNLESDVQAHRASNDMGKLVREMNFEESVRTEKMVEGDWEQNARVNQSLTRALTFDVVLVLVLLFFFYIELRTQRKIERNFSDSVKVLRESNVTLQEELVRRQLALKTTVHDLKNPLSSIHGFAELIGEEAGVSSTREFSELIRRISQNSMQMINSLLVRSDDRLLPMIPVDLREVLNELCMQLSLLARSKGQTLHYNLGSSSLPVRAHRGKLEELFGNLLGNAIKYSPKNSNIWLRFFDLGGIFRVEIEDSGPGFSNEDKAQAFTFGRRLSAQPTGGESSSGLGLFIVRQIAELHSARVEITTSPSGGSILIVEIPRHTYRLVSTMESGVENKNLDC